MTGVIRFPRLGSKRTVPLYDPIAREPEESDESWAARSAAYALYENVRVTAKLVPRATAHGWAYAWERAMYEEEARAAKAEPRPVGLTEEGCAALLALQREVVIAAGLGVTSVVIGEGPDALDLSESREPAELAELLEGCDLLGAVALAVRRAQRPTPIQSQP